ncbi:ABC transporter permease subunit [Clostridium aestuarii]|uniref:ABC transporter permease subunit n=1 Tax=Clostridium aestuarii TaxID=338193 RepID=A0ABT4D199_9CLOT|nr:glycine betaine ABC transporter substrate-binding protein [Clostridium aestuarii]MCY6485001.1 ABC transporter permease subunit [Clostridium aestuarii]
MKGFFEYFMSRSDQVGHLLIQHIGLTLVAVLVAALVGVPLGILITKKKRLSGPIIGATNIIQAVPSLALLGFLIPFLGIGSAPAVIMVFLYSLLPIVKNTYIGLKNINPDMIEASKGMGLTSGQTLRMVQIPLALPVIMAGIRIAAVTAVGLMTIAAFIGAGGLGYMVFTGVQTVNNNMVLAGAIPACILALIMDFIIGKIENAVVPEGIKSKSARVNSTKIKRRSFRRRGNGFKKTAIATSVILCIVMFTGIAATENISSKDTIVIGSKNYNEQLILGNVLAVLIEENTDLKVEKKLNLGGSSVTWEALKSGDLDMYIDYTGTGFVSIMKRDSINDAEKVYEIVKDYFNKEYDVSWLKPLGFNNTYALAVRKDTVEKYNIETFSDIAKVSDKLLLGCTMEFSERDDGYKGLQHAYNMNFKDVKGIDGGLRYQAINNKECDVVDAFSTDGLLNAFNLQVLKDDKNFFPPYYAVPLVRNDTLKLHPELKELLNKLEGTLNDEEMRKLNYKVDKEDKRPEDVAREFLKDKGLIK